MKPKSKKSKKGGEKIRKKQGIDGKRYRVAEYMTCCDCGLCHRMEYEVEINNNKPKIYFRAYRDKERTENNRKTN